MELFSSARDTNRHSNDNRCLLDSVGRLDTRSRGGGVLGQKHVLPSLQLPQALDLGYIPRFVEIGLPVPEKKIFKGFLPYMGMAASIMSSDVYFRKLKAFIKNLVQIGKIVSEEIRFEFLYVHDLGLRSRNDLDL